MTTRFDPDVKDAKGRTPLHRAVRQRDAEKVKLLLSIGASVAAVDDEGRTPLHIAAERGDVACAEPLLAAGADIEARTSMFRLTPLHSAAGHTDDPGLVHFLVEKGAQVDSRDGLGRTPLHIACEWDCPQIARVLLCAGADASARDAEGRTPCDCATANRHTSVLDVLRRHGITG